MNGSADVPRWHEGFIGPTGPKLLALPPDFDNNGSQ